MVKGGGSKVKKSYFQTEGGGHKMRITPMPQRHLMMDTGANETVFRSGKEMIRNGNPSTTISSTPSTTTEESIRIHPAGYRYDMPTPAYHMNNNAPQYSPGYVSCSRKNIILKNRKVLFLRSPT